MTISKIECNSPKRHNHQMHTHFRAHQPDDAVQQAVQKPSAEQHQNEHHQMRVDQIEILRTGKNTRDYTTSKGPPTCPLHPHHRLRRIRLLQPPDAAIQMQKLCARCQRSVQKHDQFADDLRLLRHIGKRNVLRRRWGREFQLFVVGLTIAVRFGVGRNAGSSGR